MGKEPGTMKTDHATGGGGRSGASRAREEVLWYLFKICQTGHWDQFRPASTRQMVTEPRRAQGWLGLEIRARKERLRAGCAVRVESKAGFYPALQLPAGIT